MKKATPSAQLVWGALLALAGVGVVYRTLALGEAIDEVAVLPGTAFFVRFCLYIMAILLIGGGLRKIFHNLNAIRKE